MEERPLRFTPIQRAILQVLSDGRPHTKKELHECCDELSQESVVKVHVHKLRQKLLKRGEDIVSVMRYRRTYYQHVRLLNDPYSGRT